MMEIEKREEIENKIVGSEPLTDSEIQELKVDFKEEKIKKVIAAHIAQTSEEKSILLWGFEFPEIKKTFRVMDPQMYGEEFKTETLREGKYYVLDHSEADVKKIKEKIKEFFIKDKFDDLVEKKIRINGTGKGGEFVRKIKDFLEEHKEIDVSCNSDYKFELEENFKSTTFVDDQSKQYFRLKKLFDEGLISVPNIPVESQLGAIDWTVEKNKNKAELPEENQEHIKSLILFCWGGGMGIVFVRP